MLRTIILIGFALAVAIGGGTASAWFLIDRDFGFGRIGIGPWTADPDRGTAAADPYSSARFVMSGDLSLGQAEGIAFTAHRDGLGELLVSRCDYVVEGPIPPARFWTMHLRDAGENGSRWTSDRDTALHSLAILRGEDSSFRITISRHPAPGNWLRVGDIRQFSLVLTLYDTAIATTARAADAELPEIRRIDCD